MSKAKQSRQSRWQEARICAGLCSQCGKPRDGGSVWRCRKCLQWLVDYKRRKRKLLVCRHSPQHLSRTACARAKQ